MKWLAVVALVALAAPAAAARHKILVLPVEGTADAATRGRLTAGLVRLARSLDGQVATGNATFADTALAVGCDPRAPGCRDEVMATLGVDELVWATATSDRGQVRLTVRRATRRGAAREVSTVFAADEPEDRITAGIAPVFSSDAAPLVPATGSEPASAPAIADPVAAPPAPPAPLRDRRDRTLGIALAAGGGVGVALGLSLWASYASLQDQIDHHALRTLADFREVRSLEDSASTRAIAGDLCLVAGLIAGGFGAYFLVRDHRRAVVVAPAALPGGGALTITLIGGP
jgi:hypothetical protein